MHSINSEQFEAICSEVWRDRNAVVEGRGVLTGEASLLRAVYWRLCKAGVSLSVSAENSGPLQTTLAYQLGVGCLLELHGKPRFDGTPFLKDLVERYQHEVQQVADGRLVKEAYVNR